MSVKPNPLGIGIQTGINVSKIPAVRQAASRFLQKITGTGTKTSPTTTRTVTSQYKSPGTTTTFREAADTAATVAKTTVPRSRLVQAVTSPTGIATGLTLSPLAVSGAEGLVETATGQPREFTEARRAAEIAAIGGSLFGAGALARRVSSSPTTVGKVANVVGSALFGYGGVQQIPKTIYNLRYAPSVADTTAQTTTTAPAAPATPAAPVQTRYEEIQGILDQSVSDAEAEAAAEDTALDQLYADAYQKAIAAAAPATAASAASDPVLQQELALINQSYANAKQQNAANYTAALDQVSQYQAQADQLLQQLAAEQVAGLQTATGQLVAPALGTGLTPEQAAAAGLSQTAVGGAGITGSALLGALGGVQAAQSAAGRLGTGLTLTEQLASGRLDQAALEAALGQSALEAERVARIQGAERAFATAESTRQANLAQAELALREIEGRRGEARDRRQALARARQDRNQSLVNLLAGMTDAEYRTMRGGTTTTTSPEWATKRYPVPNTKEGREKGVDAKAGIKGAPAVTVAQATNVLDALELQVQVIRQESQTEQLAQQTLQQWFADVAAAYPGVDVNAILKGQGIPTTTKALAQKAVQG